MQCCWHGACVVTDFEADIEAATARLIPGRYRLQSAGVRCFELHIAHAAIEGQGNVGGIAEAVAMLQRAGDLKLDLLGR